MVTDGDNDVSKEGKRMSVRLDADVSAKLEELSVTHRATIASLINRLLAEKLGLVPDEGNDAHERH